MPHKNQTPDKKPYYLDPHGDLRIWSEPSPDDTYYVGVDTSEGIGADFSSIIVLSATGTVVAHWTSNRTHPSRTGRIAHDLAVYYNTADLIIERNGPGLTALAAVPDYPPLYYEIRTDKTTKTQTARLGYSTSRRSKRNLLLQLLDDLTNEDFVLNSQALISEMQGFQWDPVRKNWSQHHVNALSNLKNDDNIIALGLANIGRHQAAMQPQNPDGVEYYD